MPWKVTFHSDKIPLAYFHYPFQCTVFFDDGSYEWKNRIFTTLCVKYRLKHLVSTKIYLISCLYKIKHLIFPTFYQQIKLTTM